MTSILFEIVKICRPQFKCKYLSNQKRFLNVLFHFWHLHQILNILEKKMMVIATLFRKLQTVKDLVRPLSKKHRFRMPLDRQHVKGSQTLAKSASDKIHLIFTLLRENIICKTSP